MAKDTKKATTTAKAPAKKYALGNAAIAALTGVRTAMARWPGKSPKGNIVNRPPTKAQLDSVQIPSYFLRGWAYDSLSKINMLMSGIERSGKLNLNKKAKMLLMGEKGHGGLVRYERELAGEGTKTFGHEVGQKWGLQFVKSIRAIKVEVDKGEKADLGRVVLAASVTATLAVAALNLSFDIGGKKVKGKRAVKVAAKPPATVAAVNS